jgi:mRNA interferase MazF
MSLDRASFAMTEQPRTIARTRVTGHAGVAGPECMGEIDRWLRDFTDL